MNINKLKKLPCCEESKVPDKVGYEFQLNTRLVKDQIKYLHKHRRQYGLIITMKVFESDKKENKAFSEVQHGWVEKNIFYNLYHFCRRFIPCRKAVLNRDLYFKKEDLIHEEDRKTYDIIANRTFTIIRSLKGDYITDYKFNDGSYGINTDLMVLIKII